MEMTHQHHYSTEPESWLPDQSSGDGVHYMPKLIQRRAKRIIPSDEKDDKYWEKRKRNNMAAKRSRENKRKLEIDIRQKVNYLEEDNALLRKEVSLIKAKFGIPLDQSLLTPEERAQCMREVKAAQAAQASPHDDDDDDTNSDSVYPVSLLAISSTNDDDEQNPHLMSENGHSDHDRSLTDEDSRSESAHVPARRGGGGGQSVYNSYNMAMAWGSNNQQYNPHAYNNGGQHLPPVNNAFADKPPVMDNGYPRYGGQQESQYRASPYEYYHPVFTNQGHIYNGGNPLPTAADLTTSRNKRLAVNNDVILNKHDEQVNSVSGMDAEVLHGQIAAAHDMYNGGRMHQAQMGMSESVSPNQDCIDENVKRENVELKEKLRTLTCQVEKMKNIVLKE
ncbi:nuclear factor interleukin-3-regulated protein-like [Gigantopelta aegis]|uniref:nuclear factor interleukin-3-regulated protein-like n=1 Tax=Gigantopelta aegis TaxID=1735272 RepID=UPI001B88D7F1|nr:nuclear factor interleukin-3-regulated protein-like [Gigantopelta aegis]